MPKLYDTLPRVKYFVHIGVHGGICRCRLERKAKKGPYDKVDVDGKKFSEIFDGEDGPWKDEPDVLDSEAGVDSIVERMMGRG